MNSLHLLFRYAIIATSIVISGARCALASVFGKQVLIDSPESHRGEEDSIRSRVLLQRNHGPRRLCADRRLWLVPDPAIVKRQGVRGDHTDPYSTMGSCVCQK